MKKWISYGLLVLAVPLIIILGSTVFGAKQYAFISLAVALLACIPFFLHFERGEKNGARLVLLAVMTALSVLGRLLFSVIPGFKPVTAMVILTGMYFGSETGFLCGALTAVLSNFYFGQGPWTPFQMFAWGIVGLLAGILSRRIKKSRILLCIFGALGGAIFSFVMDIWTVLWAEGHFVLSRYLAALASSAGFTAIYCVSNVLFLLVLTKPIGKKLERVCSRYGL